MAHKAKVSIKERSKLFAPSGIIKRRRHMPLARRHAKKLRPSQSRQLRGLR